MSVAGIIKTGGAAGRLALECDEGVFALTVNYLKPNRATLAASAFRGSMNVTM